MRQPSLSVVRIYACLAKLPGYGREVFQRPLVLAFFPLFISCRGKQAPPDGAGSAAADTARGRSESRVQKPKMGNTASRDKSGSGGSNSSTKLTDIKHSTVTSDRPSTTSEEPLDSRILDNFRVGDFAEILWGVSNSKIDRWYKCQVVERLTVDRIEFIDVNFLTNEKSGKKPKPSKASGRLPLQVLFRRAHLAAPNTHLEWETIHRV